MCFIILASGAAIGPCAAGLAHVLHNRLSSCQVHFGSGVALWSRASTSKMRAILLGWPIWLVLIALLSTRAADAAVAPKRAPIGAGSKAAASPRPTAKPSPRLPAVDRRVFNLGGLIVNVYGLSLLAPVVNGSTPDINVLIHMHGRTRSAMLEEPLVKTLYGNVREQMTANPSGSKNDFLVVSFDAPNHGNRTTLPFGQRGYNAGNMQFAYVSDTHAALINMQ